VDRKPLGGSIKNVLPKNQEKISLGNKQKKIPMYWLIDLWLGSLKTKYLMKYTYIKYKKKYWVGYFLLKILGQHK
jgi:hypothetical protein